MVNKSINEIIEQLNERADYKLITSLARVTGDDGEDLYLAIVNLDGVSRGVIMRETDLETVLNRAANYAEYSEESINVVENLRSAMEEIGFDRAVDLLERLQNESSHCDCGCDCCDEDDENSNY